MVQWSWWHEWMPFVIFCARSRERLQHHFRANFWVGIPSHCVLKWKLNLELLSNTNATTVAVAKITGDSGMEGGKKCLCHFFGWPEDRQFTQKRSVLGRPIAQETSHCLLTDTLWLQASENAFKVGNVKFTNSLSPPSIVKKAHTWSKSCQGT